MPDSLYIERSTEWNTGNVGSEEARITISNLVPLMNYKYGPSVLKLFSPSAVERMKGCSWDPNKEMVVGQYEDEITFLDEEDPMQTYVRHKDLTSSVSSSSKTHPSSITPINHTREPHKTTTLLHEIDDDSVSTLGNITHHKWVPPPPVQLPLPLTQRPTLPLTPNDDASLGSISTLTTRLTTMETQYKQISGAVQDIKSMLAGLAKSNYHSAQDEPPSNVKAGQGFASTGGGS